MQIRDATRRSVDALGLIALLSWFALYLEIFRYHHLVPSQIGSVLWPNAMAGSRAGGFLKTVVLCSILAPMLFMVLWTSMKAPTLRRADSTVPPSAFLSPPAMLTISGIALILLAIMNQIMRRPPIEVDLALRTGNGGFVVLGLALAIMGAVLRHRKTP